MASRTPSTRVRRSGGAARSPHIAGWQRGCRRTARSERVTLPPCRPVRSPTPHRAVGTRRQHRRASRGPHPALRRYLPSAAPRCRHRQEIDQQVDVAVGRRLASSNRPEQPRVGCVVALQHGINRIAMSGDRCSQRRALDRHDAHASEGIGRRGHRCSSGRVDEGRVMTQVLALRCGRRECPPHGAALAERLCRHRTHGVTGRRARRARTHRHERVLPEGRLGEHATSAIPLDAVGTRRSVAVRQRPDRG